ncbi:MAG: hypothetical protein H6654_11805 [Ardenticatenaceae bacterium]|nr:hypothetical protein [Ardenticatenaceae bacterium]MCB8974234.1 hypothetical protein [Ardenticatenaceae bacterium]
MEDEIDLRPYIDSLRKSWYLILVSAVSFTIIALVISSLLSPKYEANALIIVKSSDIIQLDERIRDTSQSQPLNSLPELAISDELLQTVITKLALNNINHVEQLRKILKTTQGSSTSFIQFTASYDDPELAANIASIWATEFVNHVNNIYFDYDGGQLQFYEDQLVEAESKLLNAEEELISYQSINPSGIISNTLAAYNQRQLDYLAAQQDLTFLAQDVEAHLTTLTEPANAQPVSFADQYLALSLQLRLLNLESAAPLLLQPIDSTNLTTENRLEQTATLESMLTILDNQSLALSETLTEIESQIVDLQQQLEIANTEFARLSREVTIAESTYNLLALKVEEENITSRNTGEGIRLASKPSVPIKPVSPDFIRNGIIGFLFGFIVGTFALISKQWWQIYNQQ